VVFSHPDLAYLIYVSISCSAHVCIYGRATYTLFILYLIYLIVLSIVSTVSIVSIYICWLICSQILALSHYIYYIYVYTLLLHYITVHHIASHHMIITFVLIFILLYFSFKFTVACALPCISSHYITWHGTNRHDWHGKTCIVFQYVNTYIYIYTHVNFSSMMQNQFCIYSFWNQYIYIQRERGRENLWIYVCELVTRCQPSGI
jgi:hypothetical protein